MESNKRLIKLCTLEMQNKGIYESDVYRNIIRKEMSEINIQGEHDYFLDLYDKRIKYAKNQNNLMVPWLLDIVDDFNVNKDAKYIQSDYPDIDSDFIPQIRDWLKDVWAPDTFGRDNVCSIGNYSTFGIKSALIDMSRIHGQDHHEILKLTTQLEDRDEENKPVTWEKAIDQNPLLKEYCEKNPDIAKGTQKLINRSRGRGKHAGGLIISNSAIDAMVPLTIDKQGNPVSAWTEGLHAQDLGIVGLIKYDLLVVTNLVQLALATQLVKDRHDNISVCALPGQEDWTDVDKFLEDPESIAMANESKLKCIFQFDSPGIRDLVKKGGVDCFNDLVAYTSLYRPSALNSGLAAMYVSRKRRKEEYTIHPLLEPILGNTYGVPIFQEQIMKILNIVGNIPLAHCEIVRKAISKKKVKDFKKYQEQFIENGKKNLNWEEEKVVEMWGQIESWAGYGFNKSHACAYTYLSSMLLWLKVHYPLEFFSATLSCEDDENKIKEYRLEAENCGISIKPLDINKSGVSFKIVDNEIYYGFSHIKGVGEEVAKRIVANQPYSGFVDFITRFGTDASVLKPIIGLGLFQESNRVSLWEFCEYFKEQNKKRVDRDKRAKIGLSAKIKELEQLYIEPFTGKESFEKSINKIKNDYKKTDVQEKKNKLIEKLEKTHQDRDLFATQEEFYKIIKKLKNSYRSSKAGWEKKQKDDGEIKYEDFHSTGSVITDELKKLYQGDIEVAQNKFYGFRWDRMIDKSPDYTGMTFEELDTLAETQDIFCRSCEIQVVEKPHFTKSKKGNIYWNVRCEDGNGRQELVTVWKDDFERFHEEFLFWESDAKQGNLLRIQVQRPTGDFKKYTFKSWGRQFKHLVPKSKDEDGRLVVMGRPK
jgi:DNA polymerase III alpha subunit